MERDTKEKNIQKNRKRKSDNKTIAHSSFCRWKRFGTHLAAFVVVSFKNHGFHVSQQWDWDDPMCESKRILTESPNTFFSWLSLVLFPIFSCLCCANKFFFSLSSVLWKIVMLTICLKFIYVCVNFKQTNLQRQSSSQLIKMGIKNLNASFSVCFLSFNMLWWFSNDFLHTTRYVVHIV